MRRGLSIGACAAFLLALTGAGGVASVPEQTISLKAHLPLEKCAGIRRLAVEPSLGLMILVRSNGPNTSGCPSNSHYGAALDAYASGSSNHVGTWKLTLPSLNENGIDIGVLRPLVVDLKHHRLFVIYSDGSYQDRVIVLDLTHLAGRPSPLSNLAAYALPFHADPGTAGTADDPSGSAYPSAGCTAMTANSASPSACLRTVNAAYDPGSDTLDVLMSEIQGSVDNFSSHGPNSPRPYLFQVGATSGQQRWSVFLGRCSSPLGSTNYAISFVPLADPIMVVPRAGGAFLSVGCLFSKSETRGLYPASSKPSDAALTAGSMMTYVINLKPDGSLQVDAGGNPVLAEFIGRSNVYSGLSDPVAGRFFYVAAPPLGEAGATNASGPTAVAFDIAHQVYLGAITIARPSDAALGGFMLTNAGGRLYSITGDGITAADSTATPEGQGVFFPIPLCSPATKHTTISAAIADPVSHHIFALPSVCDKFDPLPYALVYQDDVPSLSPPPTPDPDTYTRQIKEQPGVTQVQYGAHAEATGARVRLIGGVTGALKGGTSGGYDFLFDNPTGVGLPPQAGDYATREFEFAKIRTSDVSNYQSTAEAVTSAIDPQTAQQLKSGTPSVSWPFLPSSCSDPGNRTSTNAYGPDTNSSVACDFVKHGVTAHSDSGPVGLTLTLGGVDATPIPVVANVGRAHTTTSISLDPAKGLVSDTVSTVEGLGVAGVEIAVIKAESICHAHGHTATASCTYSRSIGGLRVGGVPVGPGACVQAGAIDTCSQLLATLNTIQPGILIFSMPAPDARPGFLPGSKGGYQAVAQRELYRHLQDDVLNYDPSVQLPGLQVFYNNDSTDAPSRLDIQLANVESESHYGISTAEPFTLPALVDVPAVLGDAGNLGPIGPSKLPLPALTQHPMTAGEVISTVVHRFVEGFGFMVRTPREAAGVAALVAMFATPLALAIRRRKLEDIVGGS